MASNILDDPLTRGAYPSNPVLVAPNAFNKVYTVSSGTVSIPAANQLTFSVNAAEVWLLRPFEEAVETQRVTTKWTQNNFGGRTGVAFRVQSDGLGMYLADLEPGGNVVIKRKPLGGGASVVFSTQASGVTTSNTDQRQLEITCVKDGSNASITWRVLDGAGSELATSASPVTDPTYPGAGTAGIYHELQNSNLVTGFLYETTAAYVAMTIPFATGWTQTGNKTTTTFTITPANGVPPFHVQWAKAGPRKDPDSHFLPGSGQATNFAFDAGLGDGLSAAVTNGSEDQPVWVKAVVTDGAGTVMAVPDGHGTSGVHYGRTLPSTPDSNWYCRQYGMAKPWGTPINLILVGDSITANLGTRGRIGKLLEVLIAPPRRTVATVNLGQSGSTSQQWQKVGGSGYYTGIVSAMVANAINVVSVMLGTNDVRAGTPDPAALATRLNQFITDIRTDAIAAGHDPFVIVHQLSGRPFFNGVADWERNELSRDQIRRAYAYGGRVQLGDQWVWDMIEHQCAVVDDVHPTTHDLGGYNMVEIRHAYAIANALLGVGPPRQFGLPHLGRE